MNRSQRRQAQKISVKLSPSAAAAPLFAQAFDHHRGGALREACAAYAKGLALQPDHAEAHYGRGLALHHLGKTEEAIESYRSAVLHDPRHATAYNNLALLFRQAGQLEEAEAALLEALAIDPTSPMFLSNLGAVLSDREDYGRAAEAFQKALAIDPDHAFSHTALCHVLCGLGKIDLAIAAGRRAAVVLPDVALVQHNLAVALSRTDEPVNSDESLVSVRRALALDPQLAGAHMCLALHLLARGEFAEGWAEYEWRWRLKDWMWIHDSGLPATPRWEGEALVDKTLLICAEQGLGDTLQFMRYLPLVLARARRVILWAPPALTALYRDLEGVMVIGKDRSLDGVDLYCPMLSLPRIFATTPESIPPVVSHIRADAAAVARWRAQLGDDGLRVGVCWQGTPHIAADRGRSIPLAAFAPLARIPGVRLISLQKNYGTEQLATLPEGMAVETLGDDFDTGPGAFLDTVAVMESLDLVVTSDTAIAHLAGSLGRPTWLALKRIPDWRWGLDGVESPWYPSMRLFRQTQAGDWDGVFREMAAALAD